jgi:hypothetical protein
MQVAAERGLARQLEQSLRPVPGFLRTRGLGLQLLAQLAALAAHKRELLVQT